MHMLMVVEMFTYYSPLQQYHLKGNEEKANIGIKPEEVKEVQNPENAASKEVVADKAEETPAAAAAVASEESSGSTPTAVGEESTEDNTGAAENSTEAAPEESSENTENSGEQEVEEETPEVKVGLTMTLLAVYFVGM